MARMGRPPAPSLPGCPFGLTARETQVLRFLADGRGAKHVADRTGMNVNHAYEYLQRIYTKMGVRGDVQCVLKAERAGLLKDQT